ncbi:MAG: excinuclease ABC subunit UvrC [Ruminococcaceae bacterium]|nr:excinuclease ABC subunit UvrC [Oscillospiraceae bacterium]
MMRDKKSKVIYIGKAKRLKDRVSSYFRNQESLEGKVKKMVSLVEDFDFIVTDGEYEALVLECSLIKQNYPKYNILMKDDKGFSYIRISNDEFPEISAVYRKEEDGAEYFGPYLGGYGAKKLVESVSAIFRIPTCKKKFASDKKQIGRPCLNYHLELCMGFCSGKVDDSRYRESIENARMYIGKGTSKALSNLKSEMKKSAEMLEFEKAARIRDAIKAIERIDSKQKVVKKGKNRDLDVFSFAANNNIAAATVLKFRDNKLADKYEHIAEDITDLNDFRDEFIRHNYIMENEIPPLILVDNEFESQEVFEKMLSHQKGKKVTVKVPQKGENLELVRMGYSNAIETLNLKIGRKTREESALGELSNLLGLEKTPRRIEAYDVSNYGEEAVAGMAVFIDGVPKKQFYRRFIIKTVKGVDDYSSMIEALSRRIERYNIGTKGFDKVPDLILLDGGAGHVSSVKKAVEKSSFKDVKIFGMVKDGRHHTRDLVGTDGLMSLSARRTAFSLVSKIQNEVHRYALGYQRERHSKSALKSVLTEIEGIGAKRSANLLKHFKTIDNIKNAAVEEIAKVEGISLKTAEQVFKYFNS